MHYTDVVKVLGYHFAELGCWDGEQDDWIFETQELVIILSVKVDDREKDLYIDIGILFKRRHSDEQLEEPVIDDHDIGQGLYNLLQDMGEWKYYLNNLFCYNADVNTDEEIIINIAVIVNLFKRKIIPYIAQLDNYASEADNFEKITTWAPFLQYFRPGLQIDRHFLGQLEYYYRKP